MKSCRSLSKSGGAGLRMQATHAMNKRTAIEVRIRPYCGARFSVPSRHSCRDTLHLQSASCRWSGPARSCDNRSSVGFYDRFELLDLLRDDGVKTFKAQEIATQRAVEAHLFVNPYAPLSLVLLTRIEQLPASELTRILDRGRHEGTPYFVTEPITDYPGFREWVMAKRRAPATELPPTVHPAMAGTMDRAGAWQIRPVTPPPVSTDLDQQFASLFSTAQTPAMRMPENPPPVP